MAINYAQKYAQQIDERFTLEALSTPAVNTDYDFTGAKTVNVYSIPTAAMKDYARTGASRYGTPAELENTVQALTMAKDRSFTFTIDKGNFEDTNMLNSAGEALNRQIREVIVPEVDTYRFSKMCTGAGKTATAAVTKANAYSVFLDAQAELTEQKVPIVGRVAYVSPSYYKLIKQDEAFVKHSDMAQDILVKGQLGMIDGVAIIPVPTSYLPANVAFFVTHPSACTSPVKLAEYKIHDNPPGINGWLVEGRVYYDAFVLTSKKGAIYVHKVSAT